MKIIPAILEKDFKKIKEKIIAIDDIFDLIQIDICDGKFVKNKTWQESQQLKNLRTKARFEIHLMTENPEKEIKKWQFDKVKRIVFHYESLKDLKDFSWLKSVPKRISLGIALNPKTKIEVLQKIPLRYFSYILFLGVEPGRQGQKFQERVLEKIKRIKRVNWLKKKIKIGLDGGVNEKNIGKIKKLGLDYLVIGSYFWKKWRKLMKKSIKKNEKRK